MQKNWLLVITILLVLGVFTLTGCTPDTSSLVCNSNQQEGISVNGHGEVNAAPP